MEASILIDGLSLSKGAPEYTHRLRKKGVSLVLFSVGRLWFKNVLRNSYYSSLYELSIPDLRDMARFMELPPSRVKCRSGRLASVVQGSAFTDWDSLFKELEGKDGRDG